MTQDTIWPLLAKLDGAEGRDRETAAREILDHAVIRRLAVIHAQCLSRMGRVKHSCNDTNSLPGVLCAIAWPRVLAAAALTRGSGTSLP